MSQVPQIAPLPPAPRRSDAPEDFSAKADALAAAQPGFVSQANSVANFVSQKSAEAAASSQAAKASENLLSENAEKARLASETSVEVREYVKLSRVASATSEANAKASEVASATSESNAKASELRVYKALSDVSASPVISVLGYGGAVSESSMKEAGVVFSDQFAPLAAAVRKQRIFNLLGLNI